MIQRPKPSEYPDHFQRYIDRVPDGDVLKQLETQWRETRALVTSLPESKLLFRYAEGKWSIKEMLVHVSDAERIFAYRALRFARRDAAPLAGWDENTYAREYRAENRVVVSILEELDSVRGSSIHLFKNFDEIALGLSGTANNKTCSVRALAWIIAGHELHHRNVILERYLK